MYTSPLARAKTFLCLYSVFRVLFSRGFAFFEGGKNSFGLRKPEEGSVTLRGERGTERDQKKIQFFFTVRVLV